MQSSADFLPPAQPSQAIDHLADVCLVVLRSQSNGGHIGARAAAVKLWGFMRPEVPSKLSSAQHHTASRLLNWAEHALGDAARADPSVREDLARAIAAAVGVLGRDPPPPARKKSRASRRA